MPDTLYYQYITNLADNQYYLGRGTHFPVDYALNHCIQVILVGLRGALNYAGQTDVRQTNPTLF